ncbi:MAG: ubiquinone-dependent pyruvate dehydrogenase [Burkholderiales bacterium]|jgi:pyruvate dehydrogenase (quinone)|nr:ubiquinone-dependent pyruvate dehydrogenase [Burkholderiales bacterium]MBP9769368.1 ubiquinone-dependent pyruvate dehydrogenase [Burkholderiales bacterium]
MFTKKTVADGMVEILKELGIKRYYCVPGDSMNEVTTRLEGAGIQFIHTRNEGAAVFAAGAEAQLTGKITICAGSAGPGSLHLVNGVHEASRMNAPMLVFATNIPSTEIGGKYFQESDLKSIFKDSTCFCEMVISADQMPRLLNIAIQTAIAKKAVAVLIFSGDVTQQDAIHQVKKQCLPKYFNPVITPSEEELDSIAKLLNDSKKVALFCGYGCKNSHDQVVKLAEKLKSPVIHALRGKEFIEYDNPYDVGMTGLLGATSGYLAIKECDVLVLLGTGFPYRQFYPEQAKVIQLDIDGENIGRRVGVNIGAVGDVKPTIELLLPKLQKKAERGFLDAALKHYKKSRQSFDKLATFSVGDTTIHPQYLAKMIDNLANDDTIFSVGTGTPIAWAARYLTMNSKRRITGSFNNGSIGTSLSQAIGAQSAYPERQVIAMCGDGGLAMFLGEFITVENFNLPIKIIIFNNHSYGFVQLEMIEAGIYSHNTDLKNPDFAKVAEAIGIKGISINKPEDIESGLKEALAYNGPVVVDVKVSSHELIMPPTVEIDQVKGFALYASRVILDGDFKTLIDVAKENLFH